MSALGGKLTLRSLYMGQGEAMTLKFLQRLWIGAFVLFLGSILLDVVDAWDVPTAYIVLVASLLFLSDQLIMPSLKELDRSCRRRR